MGLVLQRDYPELTRLGLWKIEESVDDLLKQCPLRADQQAYFQTLNRTERQLEWLAARVLINQLSGQEEHVYYDEWRKPHLTSERFQISLSHSAGMVGVVLHPKTQTGLDLQAPTGRVINIRRKFMSASELEELGAPEDEKLHIYWCAKEAIYKYYGKKRLIFAQDLYVHPFDWAEAGTLVGELRLKGEEQSLQLRFERWQGYFLVFVLNG